jgi:hypothetical protein
MNMDYRKLSELVFETAVELARKGPGWAQQGVVLNAVAERISATKRDERLQQRILTCWHDLFRSGHLSWGYNLDNPDAPFYHVPEKDSNRVG